MEVPGQLENAVNWLSRPRGKPALDGKTVAVIGTGTGAYGGVWAQADLRKTPGIAGARVLEVELAVGHVGDHLCEDGPVVDADVHERLQRARRLIVGRYVPSTEYAHRRRPADGPGSGFGALVLRARARPAHS